MTKLRVLSTLFTAAMLSTQVQAAETCSQLPDHAALKEALTAARGQENAGFNLDMWGALVARDGTVCTVVHTGKHWGDQWPASRIIAAQKAYTANSLSLPGLSLATANLYTGTQPGGSLFGLQESNPVDAQVAYAGAANSWGTSADPLVGKRMGGINVFGGGLALYNKKGEIVGALGVSGDSSCADHFIAWRTRNALELDYVPGGVGPGKLDQIAFTGPWSQPHCLDADKEDAVVSDLPPARKK